MRKAPSQGSHPTNRDETNGLVSIIDEISRVWWGPRDDVSHMRDPLRGSCRRWIVEQDWQYGDGNHQLLVVKAIAKPDGEDSLCEQVEVKHEGRYKIQ